MIETLSIASISSTIISPLMIVGVFVYLLAGVVKGTLGIGFPTTAVSMMAQITDARTAISLVLVPMVVTNAWQVYRNRRIHWVVSNFWLLILFMLFFIAIFSQVASLVPLAVLTTTLGVIVSVYAASSLYKPVLRISDSSDKTAQCVTGSVSGIMGGIAGVWAPPILIYLNARQLSKEQFVSTAGLLLFLGSVVLFAGYSYRGLLPPLLLVMSCLLLLPSMLGFSMGEQIRKRLSAHRFERALLWFFLLMGLNLIGRAWL